MFLYYMMESRLTQLSCLPEIQIREAQRRISKACSLMFHWVLVVVAGETWTIYISKLAPQTIEVLEAYDQMRDGGALAPFRSTQ